MTLERPGNYAERQISRWEKQWHLSKQRELPEIDIIINWLNKNIPNKFENFNSSWRLQIRQFNI